MANIVGRNTQGYLGAEAEVQGASRWLGNHVLMVGETCPSFAMYLPQVQNAQSALLWLNFGSPGLRLNLLGVSSTRPESKGRLPVAVFKECYAKK
jgi:hypothetical protein